MVSFIYPIFHRTFDTTLIVVYSIYPLPVTRHFHTGLVLGHPCPFCHSTSSIPDKKCLLPVDLSGPNHPRFGQHPVSSIQHPIHYNPLTLPQLRDRLFSNHASRRIRTPVGAFPTCRRRGNKFVSSHTTHHAFKSFTSFWMRTLIIMIIIII